MNLFPCRRLFLIRTCIRERVQKHINLVCRYIDILFYAGVCWEILRKKKKDKFSENNILQQRAIWEEVVNRVLFNAFLIGLHLGWKNASVPKFNKLCRQLWRVDGTKNAWTDIGRIAKLKSIEKMIVNNKSWIYFMFFIVLHRYAETCYRLTISSMSYTFSVFVKLVKNTCVIQRSFS